MIFTKCWDGVTMSYPDEPACSLVKTTTFDYKASTVTLIPFS